MRKVILGLVFSVSLTAANVQVASNPAGRWRTQMQGALVEIRTCADRSPCAFLVWVDQSISQGITTDVRNPNPALRSRPLLGVPILWGLRPSGNGWQGGRVYNPETGQTFRSSMEPLLDRRLRVTGCWGPLCRSEIWVKVDNSHQ